MDITSASAVLHHRVQSGAAGFNTGKGDKLSKNPAAACLAVADWGEQNPWVKGSVCVLF